MTLLLLATLWTSPAEAGEIVFKTTRPVSFLVDDRPATLGKRLVATSHWLEPGSHAVEVRSLFGKTLFSTEVVVGAEERLEAEWRGDGLIFARAEPETPVSDERETVASLPPAEPRPASDVAALALPADGVSPAAESSAEPGGGEEQTALAAVQPALPVDPDAYPVFAPEVQEVEPLSGEFAEGQPVRIVVEQGGSSIAIEIDDGALVVSDSTGEVKVALALPGHEEASGMVSFVRPDGAGAVIVVDGEPVGAIAPESTQTTLSLPAGEREVELRALDDNRLLHIGRLEVPPGESVQVGFGPDFEPAVAERPEAWRAW